MKRFIITFISMLILLFTLPCMAYAVEEPINSENEERYVEEDILPLPESEDTVISSEEFERSNLEFIEVSTQDVEVYVTTGYEAIPGAKVELAGKTLVTNENGKVLFNNVLARDKFYDISVNAPGFGEKKVQLQVEKKIEKGVQPFIAFTVSYWQSEQDDLERNYVDMPNKMAATMQEDDEYRVEGEWIKSSEMPIVLSNQVVCSDSEKICVIGNADKNKEQLWTVMVYDKRYDQWSEGAKLKVGRRSPYIFTNNGYMYLIGGDIYTDPDNLNKSDVILNSRRVDIYKLSSNVWIEGQSAPINFNGDSANPAQHITGGYGNEILIYKKNSDNNYGEFYSYNSYKQVWTYKSDMELTNAFDNPTMIICDSKIISIHGAKKNKLSIYDFLQKEWMDRADLLYENSCVNIIGDSNGMFMYNSSDMCHYFLVIGSDSSKPDKTTLEFYNFEQDTWIEGNSLDYASEFISIYPNYNKVYVVGNFGGEGNQLRIYDFQKEQWGKGNNLNELRNKFDYFGNYTYTSYGQDYTKLYIAGGNDEVSFIDIYQVAKDKNITNVDYFDEIVVPYGTPVEDVLRILQDTHPTVAVSLDNGKRIEKDDPGAISVEWMEPDNNQLGAYNPIVSASYYFSGNLINLPIDVFYDMNLIHVSIPVRVGEPPEPYLIKAHTIPNHLEVELNTPAEDLDELLPKQMYANLSDGTEQTFNITSWDKSMYVQDVHGLYEVRGYPEAVEGIIQMYDVYASVYVEVAPPQNLQIVKIDKIEMEVDQGILLEQEWLPHSLGEPETVPLPEKVTVELKDGTIENLKVKWDVTSYNQHKTGKQIVYGEVILIGDLHGEYNVIDGISNPNNYKAELEINVIPTNYEVLGSNPQKISVDAVLGMTMEQIHDIIEQQTIDLHVRYADGSPKAGEEIYIYSGLVFEEEDNVSFDPNALGKQNLICRFYDNFLVPYVDVEVNIVQAKITSVAFSYAKTYQYIDFNDIDNVPKKALVFLSDGLGADISMYADVEWRSENYSKHYGRQQYMFGDLRNLPVGALPPDKEQTVLLIIDVQPVDCIIQEVIPDKDYFSTGRDENMLSSGLELYELRMNLPIDRVKVRLKSVTKGVDLEVDYELDFTLEEMNNESYLYENKDYYDLCGTLITYDNIYNLYEKTFDFGIFTNPVAILEAEPSSLSVDTKTTMEEFNNLLPTETRVELANGNTRTLSISSWDKSQYVQDVAGEYTVYGTIQLADGVVNPRNIRAEVKVQVNIPAKQDIVSIQPIQMQADQSVPLEQEGLTHSLSDPVTVSLPQTVEADLRDERTVELGVNWDIASYNPHQTGEQTISGEVVLTDDVTNTKNIKPELEITVVPTEYEILESSPQKISVEVLAGTTKEQIWEQIEPKVIDVDVVNAETFEEIYIYTGFTFDDEANANFDSYKLGKQILMGRFYSNFLDTVEPPYVEVEVNVVEAEIVSVPEKHVDTYQYTAFNNIPNLPSQVTVTLENGMTVDVDVVWNSANYDRDTVGDQLISGDLVNLPAGIKQPQEAKTAPLIVHVLPLDYKVAAVTPEEDFFDTDKDGNELYAGFTLSELREKLPVDKVKIQLESVTEGINYSTEYEVDFNLDEENNTTYVPEEEFFDNLYGTLVLPTNISNPDDLLYEFIVQTNPVEILSLEPASVMVDYYTEFSEINLPETVYAELSNGQRKAISVDWGTGEGYNPDPEELTEDNPVVFTVNGTLIDIPQYINHYDTDIPQLNITLVLPRVYNIVEVSPVRIPETGSTKVNLGSSLADIYDMLESHTATVTLENLKGVRTTQDVTFTLREEDNGHYDSMSEDEVELVAYLNLPESVNNPNNKQLVIAVQPTKYVIRTTVASRVNGVLKGTAFADIEMPDKVTVNYTDTVTKQGEVPVASWDGSKYNPDKIGNQAVKGTFPNPLPVYVSNPNNRTPSAIVNVVDPEARMLSARQVAVDSQLSGQMRSVKRAQSEVIDGYIERMYEVELLHKDGSITTEIISIFVEVE